MTHAVPNQHIGFNKLQELTFPTGHIAQSARVSSARELPAALDALGLCRPSPTLVLVGGASGMSQESLQGLSQLFLHTLVPAAESLGLSVLDGGTDSGVMQLMGQAYQQKAATFPLVGVAAIGTVNLPNSPSPSEEAAALEPHHTHFLLVPGFLWGDEAPWIAQTASVLAAGAASLTMLVNGGKIAWMDVTESVKAQRPVITIAGSGRTADALAAAVRGEDRSNERANKLVNSGLLQVFDLADRTEMLTKVIDQVFSRAPN